MCVLIFSTAFAWNISHSKKKWGRCDKNVWFPSNEPVILVRFLEKYSNIKFHENPSSGSQVVPCGRTDGRTGMTKLTVAVCNFANAPKNVTLLILYIQMKWLFVRFCLFVCLFVPYTNPHFRSDLNRPLHTSPPSSGGGRRVCMDPQYLTLFDLFGLFCQEPVQNPGHNIAAGTTVNATALYPWSSRRHLREESSVTVLYPWYSRRQLRILQVPCTMHR
jgi:hypothetical protein